MTDNITVPLHYYLVQRGREILNISVPEHEGLVLAAIHGRSNVRERDVPEDDRLDVELSISADIEFARMQAKYRRTNTPDMVQAAFPRGAKDLEEFGFKLGRGEATAPPASKVRDRRVEAKKAAKGEPQKRGPGRPQKE